MDHRAHSIQFIRSTGLIPVRVRPQQKDAYPSWDPRLVLGQDNNKLLEDLSNGSTDNLAALFYGRYIDMDVDSKDPALLASLDHFLPNTQFVWGRKSKPRSHRVYQLQGDFERGPYGTMLRYLKAEHEVEFRGGRTENGLYSVLPGSIHPSSERYEWESEFDPSVSVATVPILRLISATRFAVAASLVAGYWQPGVRNDLAMAFAGLLWRIRNSSLMAMGYDTELEIADDQFLLTEALAKRVFEAVMMLAGDDASDRNSRIITFNNTWKKLAVDPTSKVTGGKVLASLIGAEEGPKFIRHLYRLLSDNPDIEAMEQLAEQFVMWYGPGVIVDLDLVEKGRTTPWMTKEQATNSLAGHRIAFGEKKVPFAALLFNSKVIRRIAGLTFDPSTSEQLVETPEGIMINQWRGFETEPCSQSVTSHEVQPFIDYIKEVISDGSEQMYEWVMSWLADLLQKPHEKPGTALVLVGVQGAGKSFLGEKIVGAIIGKGHAGQTNSITALTDKFNTIVDNKIFLQCDEAIHSYQKDVSSRLKSIVTDETMTIEPKGVNSYRKPNHMHLLFTSNEEHTAMFIDSSPYERRFTVSRVSSKRAKDMNYWAIMHKWVKNNLSKIMRWLLDFAYDKEFIRRPVETTAKKNMQKVGLDPEISWIINRIGSGNILDAKNHKHWFDSFDPKLISDKEKENDSIIRNGWPTLVNITALEADFKAYVREHGRPVYSGSILTSIKRALPDDSLKFVKHMSVAHFDPRTNQMTKGLVKLYSVPRPNDITDNLKDRYGNVIDDLMAEGEVVTIEEEEKIEYTIPEDLKEREEF